MTTTEILEKIARDNGMSIGAFCSFMGFKTTYTYDITHYRTKAISPKVAKEICEKFPNYRKLWLMTGEGEPYTEEYMARKEVKEKKSEVDELKEVISDLRQQITDKDKLITEMITDRAQADRDYRQQISSLLSTITNRNTSTYGMAAEPVPHPNLTESKEE